MAFNLLADGILVNDADSGLLADGVILVAAGSNPAPQLVTGANSQQVNQVISGSVSAGSGTLQIPPLSEWETGNLLPGQTGITVWINDEESGALVLKLTGLSTAAITAAFSPISDVSLVPGNAYSVRTRLANGAQYTWTYVAS